MTLAPPRAGPERAPLSLLNLVSLQLFSQMGALACISPSTEFICFLGMHSFIHLLISSFTHLFIDFLIHVFIYLHLIAKFIL